MNKKLMWMPAVLFSAVVAHMPVANAADGMAHCEYLEKIEKKLDLSAEQKSKIKEIHDKARDTIKADVVKARDIHAQINEQIKAGGKDSSKLDDLVKQETDVVSDIIKARIAVRLQVYDVLTDAQKQKFAGMVSKWEAKHMYYE